MTKNAETGALREEWRASLKRWAAEHLAGWNQPEADAKNSEAELHEMAAELRRRFAAARDAYHERLLAAMLEDEVCNFALSRGKPMGAVKLLYLSDHEPPEPEYSAYVQAKAEWRDSKRAWVEIGEVTGTRQGVVILDDFAEPSDDELEEMV